MDKTATLSRNDTILACVMCENSLYVLDPADKGPKYTVQVYCKLQTPDTLYRHIMNILSVSVQSNSIVNISETAIAEMESLPYLTYNLRDIIFMISSISGATTGMSPNTRVALFLDSILYNGDQSILPECPLDLQKRICKCEECPHFNPGTDICTKGGKFILNPRIVDLCCPADMLNKDNIYDWVCNSTFHDIQVRPDAKYLLKYYRKFVIPTIGDPVCAHQ